MIDARPERLTLDRIASPIGDMLVVTDAQGVLRSLWFDDGELDRRRSPRLQYGALPLEPGSAPEFIRRALLAYFDGEIAALDRIPWAAAGTPFQEAVWRALRLVPAGATISYGALAARIGRQAAVRAVGAANGANPISIVVPCHRVIGANRALTGYGGGLERKRWLLAHEGVGFGLR